MRFKASGIFAKKSERLWLPVSAYLIEGEHGKVLFDCGWHREMSPRGVFDRRAQIGSLGSLPLYLTNQGLVGRGEAIDEQLAALGLRVIPSDANYLLFRAAPGLDAALREQGILIRNCENYAGLCPGWYRIAVRTRAENGALIRALREV